jgi:hypothetical protein
MTEKEMVKSLDGTLESLRETRRIIEEIAEMVRRLPEPPKPGKPAPIARGKMRLVVDGERRAA